MRVQRTFVSSASPVTPVNGAGFAPCQGLWHHPGVPVKTAFIATHYNVDFSEQYLAPLLAARGYGFLGWNTKYRGAEALFRLDHALCEIAVGVRWLRDQGVENIVLLGNSGGGSLMAAYESQAQGVTLRSVAGEGLPEALEALPGADYYISLNAHGGRPEVLTAWSDPSVIDERDPFAKDPALDLFAQPLPLASAFVARYRAAQEARNHRITAWARNRLEALVAAGYRDEAFLFHRAWADPRMWDSALDPSDRAPQRCYAGNPSRANFTPFNVGLTCTLRSWLAMWSLEASDCRGAPHLARLRVPALVLQSTADTGVFPSDAQAIYGALGSEDKALVMIPGDHYLTEPAGAREAAADHIDRWLKERGA